MLIRRCALLPEPGRSLAAATLANTIGTGIWLSGSAPFFTRSVGLSAAQLGVGISTAGVFGLAAAIPLGATKTLFTDLPRPCRRVDLVVYPDALRVAASG